MITSWDIYWITRLDSINGGLIAFALTAGIGGLISVLFGHLEDEGTAKKLGIAGVIVGLFLSAAAVLTPTTKQYAAIVMLPKIANNEQIAELPENAAALLNKQLKAWVDDLTLTGKQ